LLEYNKVAFMSRHCAMKFGRGEAGFGPARSLALSNKAHCVTDAHPQILEKMGAEAPLEHGRVISRKH
jgi:hypothetical protein